VLPFENLTGDPEQAYFSDGLTEEMITQLGRTAPAAAPPKWWAQVVGAPRLDPHKY
jgi:hypothetical protein